MQAQFFQGVTQVVKETPHGGKITVAFGNISVNEDTPEVPAIAIQIVDKEGTNVAEFALLPETFGTLIEAIKELYDGEFA
jgi:hypothetical protein